MEKNHVIDLINTHIDEIKTESKEPGWSTWAFIVGFCSIAFLLYNEWSAFQGNLNHILILTFAEYNILDCLRTFFFTKKLKNSSNQLFIKPATDAFSISNRRMVLLICYMLFFIWINHDYNLYNPVKTTIYAYLGLMILLCVSTIIISHFNLPVVTSKTKKNKLIQTIIFIILRLTPIVVSFYILFSEIEDIKTQRNDIELSVLIALELVVLYLLIKSTEKNKTLHNLFQLKQDLLYERIESSDAINRLEIIISGSRLNKIMEKELGKIIETIHEVENDFRQAHKYAEKIHSLGNDENLILSKETLIDAIRTRVNKTKEKMIVLAKYYTTFTLKFKVIVTQAEDDIEIKEIEDMVANEIDKLNNQMKKLKACLLSIGDKNEITESSVQ